jgi:ABC-type branched-subunit amino acid transport system permease subunit
VVATLALISTATLASLVVLTGYVGQISRCQASFMRFGAFFCAALIGHYGWSWSIAAPSAVALVFLAGAWWGCRPCVCAG